MCPNLAFSKSLVQKTFETINDLKAKSDSKWLIGDHFDSWPECMTKRFRNLCRAVQQSARKSPPPAWVDELGLGMGKQCDGGKQSKAASGDSGEWFYGFDKDLRQAWRSKSNSGPKDP